jgi:hypothetical protein
MPTGKTVQSAAIGEPGAIGVGAGGLIAVVRSFLCLDGVNDGKGNSGDLGQVVVIGHGPEAADLLFNGNARHVIRLARIVFEKSGFFVRLQWRPFERRL